MSTGDDLLRKIVELAYQSGRALQKEETGLLHYHPHLPENSAISIPVYENMLFCLALLRTKKLENMQEAKIILDRLLFFQEQIPGENGGNFPQYLHEFPYCRDHFLAMRLLLPLHWIKRDFSSVLGESLAKRVEVSFQRLMSFSKRLKEQIALPLFAQILIGEVAEIATLELGKLMSPATLGDVLAALQMREIEPHNFWQFLYLTYHQGLKKYVGPAVGLVQNGFEPACTLYDYYMGYFSGALSERALKPQIAALQATVVQPNAQALGEAPFPSLITESWMVHQEQNFAISLSKMYPLYFVTKNHTLVLDIPKGMVEEWSFNKEKRKAELVLQLSDDIVVDSIEKAYALNFFVNYEPAIALFVNGQKATTFSLSDSIEIMQDGLKIELRFQLESGTGAFMGHIRRANRPLQMRTKGPDRYAAYDLQILLRAVRKCEACKLKVTFEISHV